jgi:anti-sigma regulatory factor (Ser/Thr protein kinase)
MNAVRREADLTTPPGVAGEPLLGLIYLDVSGGRLQFLNEAGRQLQEGGLPVLGHEPSLDRLRAPGGESVPPAALPLAIAAREARAVEARYILSRPGLAEWHLHWTAAPLLDAAGHVSAVIAAVCCTPPQPDWHTLAGLAHDLRTPLQTLRFLAAALAQVPPRPEDLGRLQSAAERTQQIGADLLDWCRAPMQGGRLVEADWFALAPLLSELVQEQQGTAERKGVALRGEVTAAAGWDVFSDRVRLGRALANLLSNAVRYTAAGGQVTLTASWRGEGDERALALEVTDTGAGISPEELESIFQPFARGSAGRGDSSGGSGLGLAVVDRLVKELGLRRGFDSEHGRGSDFRVLVPARLLRGG